MIYYWIEEYYYYPHFIFGLYTFSSSNWVITICPSEARRDSDFFQFNTKLSPRLLFPASPLLNNCQSYHSHCMFYLCVYLCLCTRMFFFFMRVIWSLCACAFHRLVFLFVIVVVMEAAKLELGRFVWCTLCKQILQRMMFYWPSTVCFSGACGFKISSSNYIHWIHLKSAMVVLIISTDNTISCKQMMVKYKMKTLLVLKAHVGESV